MRAALAAVTLLLSALGIFACANEDEAPVRVEHLPATQSQSQQAPEQHAALTAADLAGLNLTQAMRALYDSIASGYGAVCGADTGEKGVGGPTGLTAGDAVPPEAVAVVSRWSGSLWVGEYEDYELRDVDGRRILLISADPVPPPHEGYRPEAIASGLTLIKSRGHWDVGRIGHLRDCSAELGGSRLQYESYIEEVEDGEEDPGDHRFELLEVADDGDWPPPNVDLPVLSELLTRTARERWEADFVCVTLTRYPLESAVAVTGLSADADWPEDLLALFEELAQRLHPDRATLRHFGERNVVLAWVTAYEHEGTSVGWVTAGEYVRTVDGDWSTRSWLSMYSCDYWMDEE